MTKKGKGSLALTLDLFCSAIGGTIGIVLLIVVAPPLANLALQFTNYEYFWLGLFGLSMSVVLSKGNVIKGIIGRNHRAPHFYDRNGYNHGIPEIHISEYRIDGWN